MVLLFRTRASAERERNMPLADNHVIPIPWLARAQVPPQSKRASRAMSASGLACMVSFEAYLDLSSLNVILMFQLATYLKDVYNQSLKVLPICRPSHRMQSQRSITLFRGRKRPSF